MRIQTASIFSKCFKYIQQNTTSLASHLYGYSGRVHLRGNSDTLTTGAPDHLYSGIHDEWTRQTLFFFFFFPVGGPACSRGEDEYITIISKRTRAGARAQSSFLFPFTILSFGAQARQIKRRPEIPALFITEMESPVYKYMGDIQCFPFSLPARFRTIPFRTESKSSCVPQTYRRSVVAGRDDRARNSSFK